MAAKKSTAKLRSEAKPEIDSEGAQDTGGPSVIPFEEVTPEPEAEPHAEFVQHDGAVNAGGPPEATVPSDLNQEPGAYEYEYEPEFTDDAEIDDGGRAPDFVPEDFSDLDAIPDQSAIPSSEDFADGGVAAVSDMIELLDIEEA